MTTAALLLATLSAAAPAAVPPGASPAPPAAQPAPPADGAPATAPGARVVTAQAPVVGGNAASARERALDDAIRQAVTLTLADIVDPQTRAAQAKTIKAIEAKARSFVPRYRTLEEGEVAGMYNIRLEVEVDEIALRRRLERSSAPPPTPATPARPGGPSLLIVPADPGEATASFSAQFRKALASGGVTVQPAAGVETSVPAAAAAAQRAGMDQAVLIAVDMTSEGPVRGTGRSSWSCRAVARVVAAGSGGAPAERTATTRVFVEANKPADSACFTPLIGELGARITGAVTTYPLGVGGRPAARHAGRRRRGTCRRAGAAQEPARPGYRVVGGAATRCRGPGRDPDPDAGGHAGAGGRPLAHRQFDDHTERRGDQRRCHPAARPAAPGSGGDRRGGRGTVRRPRLSLARTACGLLLLALVSCAHIGSTNGIVFRVDCNVPDATVWIDDVLVGKAADFKKDGRQIKPGFHRVEVRHPNYYSFFQEVELPGGSKVVVNARLRELVE